MIIKLAAWVVVGWAALKILGVALDVLLAIVDEHNEVRRRREAIKRKRHREAEEESRRLAAEEVARKRHAEELAREAARKADEDGQMRRYWDHSLRSTHAYDDEAN